MKPEGQQSWQLHKNQAGKWSWLGLGGYPAISPALARKKAAELRKEVSHGNDPLLIRREQQAAELEAATNTFEKLAREWIKIRTPGWADNTTVRTVRGLELHVFPVFGKRPFAQILPIEWMEFLRGMEQKGSSFR